MKIRSQLKGGIYDVNFRYNTNLGVYTTLMSDIPKLYEMRVNNRRFSYGCIELATN